MYLYQILSNMTAFMITGVFVSVCAVVILSMNHAFNLDTYIHEDSAKIEARKMRIRYAYYAVMVFIVLAFLVPNQATVDSWFK